MHEECRISTLLDSIRAEGGRVDDVGDAALDVCYFPKGNQVEVTPLYIRMCIWLNSRIPVSERALFRPIPSSEGVPGLAGKVSSLHFLADS